MNNEDYVSYELAKKLKACGFDEPCDHYYCAFDNETNVRFWSVLPAQSQNGFTNPDGKVIADAPTLAHAQKWLREKKGIAINVIAHDGGAYDYDIVFLPNAVDCDYPIDRATFSRTYEEALNDGIESALKLIEQENK